MRISAPSALAADGHPACSSFSEAGRLAWVHSKLQCDAREPAMRDASEAAMAQTPLETNCCNQEPLHSWKTRCAPSPPSNFVITRSQPRATTHPRS